MNYKTKKNVFEQLLNEYQKLIMKHMDMELSDESYSERIVGPWIIDYNAALPDDLPVIPKCVSEELRAEYGKNSLPDELVWARQDALPSSEISEWINNNNAIFAEAWSRGLWKVKETGEIVKLDVTK